MSNLWSQPPDSWTGSAEEYQEGLAILCELDYRRCTTDPSHFIETHLTTVDTVDQEHPDKPFPKIDYLRWLDDFLLTEKMLLVPKSRRVLVTWRIAGFFLWDCIFNQASVNAFLNEDLDKACQMILMVKQLYDSLPPWIKQRAPMKWTTEKVYFPRTRSSCTAFEQGPDVGRMWAFRRIWIDEAQDQRHPYATYQSMHATTKGRLASVSGQIVYSGTAKQGWWCLACHDQLTTPTPRPPAWERQLCPDAAPKKPGLPFGVVVRRLTESGALVMQVHYTADPVKRTVEWHEATHKGVKDEDWDQEYEINWKAKAGKPAITQLRLRWDEIVVPAFKPPPWWPRFITGDYGANANPTSWHFHAIGPDGKGYTYDEIYGIAPLAVVAARLKAHPDFPALRLRILDGACWALTQQASETSLEGRTAHMIKSIAQLYAEQGVICIPAARNLSDPVKIAAIERVWPPPIPGEPLRPVIWHVMDNCPNLLRECEGQVWEKLTYAQALKKNDPAKLVDKDNHAFDEFCYGLLHYATPELEAVALAMSDAEARDKMRATIQNENIERIDDENRHAGYDDGYGDGLD